jgi:hypothetical protein
VSGPGLPISWGGGGGAAMPGMVGAGRVRRSKTVAVLWSHREHLARLPGESVDEDTGKYVDQNFQLAGEKNGLKKWGGW